MMDRPDDRRGRSRGASEFSEDGCGADRRARRPGVGSRRAVRGRRSGSASNCGATTMEIAHDQAQRERIWKGRKAAFAAMGRVSPNYYVQDGVVPRTKLPEVLRRIRDLEARSGLRIGNVFHAGDGNLHPLICYDEAIPGQAEHAEQVAAEILTYCIEAGGAITGEHGVGVDKKGVHAEDVRRATISTPCSWCGARSIRPASAIPAKCFRRRGCAAKSRARIGSIRSSAPDWRSGSDVDDPAPVRARGRRRRRGRAAVGRRRRTSSVTVRGGGDEDRAAARRRSCSRRRSLTAGVDHVAGDLVATLPAGATLEAVNDVLRREGQWLPLDPPRASRATIGGIVATNDSGPRRHRFGAPRDLIIGIEIALADGRTAKAGGRVVKNVAGYDLSRLLCGSLGSLAVVTSATFKLSPAAAALADARGDGRGHPAAWRAGAGDRRRAGQRRRRSSCSRRRTACSSGSRRPNRPRGVQTELANAVCVEHGATCTVVSGKAEADAWRAHEGRIFSTDGTIVKMASCRPTWPTCSTVDQDGWRRNAASSRASSDARRSASCSCGSGATRRTGRHRHRVAARSDRPAAAAPSCCRLRPDCCRTSDAGDRRRRRSVHARRQGAVRSAEHSSTLAWAPWDHERAFTVVRVARAARAADRQVRPLRLLPADLPQLPPARTGNGLAPRPHLHDEGRRRRPARRSTTGMVRPLRHVPRLHGVRNGVPVRRAVRAAHRGNARRDRAPPPAPDRRADVPATCSSGCCRTRHRLRLIAQPLVFVNALRRYPRLLALMPLTLRNLVALAPDASHAGAAKETPETHARRRRDAAARRVRDRLRPARLLRSRQRGHRPRARRRGLRGAGPGAAGLLRRARAALGTGRRGARASRAS